MLLVYLMHYVGNFIIIPLILLNSFMVAECGALKLMHADSNTIHLPLVQIQLKLFQILQPTLRQAFSLFYLKGEVGV